MWSKAPQWASGMKHMRGESLNQIGITWAAAEATEDRKHQNAEDYANCAWSLGCLFDEPILNFRFFIGIVGLVDFFCSEKQLCGGGYL